MSPDWPKLPYDAWVATRDTLHTHTQILGAGAADPHATAVAFARSAFRHACLVCEWDGALAASSEGAPPPVR